MRTISVSTIVKLCLGVILCISLIMYTTWDSTQTAIRTRFLMQEGTGFYQLVPSATSNNTIDEQPEAYSRWTIQYDLRIIAIVYNRAHSLLRLLKSLNEADYYNDRVKLEVWIDRSVEGSVDSLTLQSAHMFEFKHGEYEVIPHPKHVGIFGQWLTTWKVWQNSSEIAVILEDDLTVSPYFYKYLKLVHSMYDSYPDINGYALQSVSIKHNSGSGKLEGPKDSIVFLYPVIGTWGFSPSNSNWGSFIQWFNEHWSNKDFEPIVPGNIVTNWYRTFKNQGKTNSMWSIWHIYYAWLNKEFTLYSNFEGHRGLSVNWKEAGLHYTAMETKASNDALIEWQDRYNSLPSLPPRLNIAGKLVTEG